MTKAQVVEAIASIADGARVQVAVNPALNKECSLVARALSRSEDIQWLGGVLVKNCSTTAFFVPEGTCYRLPLTRRYRRPPLEPRGRRHDKTAVFDYVLHIFAEEIR